MHLKIFLDRKTDRLIDLSGTIVTDKEKKETIKVMKKVLMHLFLLHLKFNNIIFQLYKNDSTVRHLSNKNHMIIKINYPKVF